MAIQSHGNNLPTVSVVLAHCGANADLIAALSALSHQTLPTDQFEVIVVYSDEKTTGIDNTNELRSRFQQMNIRFIRGTFDSNLQVFRLGVAAANNDFVTYFQATDEIPSSLLISGLTLANPSTLVSGSRSSRPLQDRTDLEKTLESLDSFSGKLLVTEVARRISTAGALSSTTSPAVFWAHCIALFDCAVELLAETDCAVVSESEVLGRSRADQDTRIDRIKSLASIDQSHATESTREILDALISREARYINSFLTTNPNYQREIAESLEDTAGNSFSFSDLNAGLARTLVISYAFPPTLDTSALAMARRVRKWAKPVSVISNDLSETHKTYAEGLKLTDPFVERYVTLQAPPNFLNWADVSKFISLGLDYTGNNEQWFRQHDTIYSHANPAASHFLAVLLKTKYPDKKWIAEFSDPLIRNVENTLRYLKIDDPGNDAVLDQLRRLIASVNLTELAGDNLFQWGELLAYAYADEIVFANDHQRRYMIDYLDDPILTDRVEQISYADEYPSPPIGFYSAANPPFELDPTKINIGFFGYVYMFRRLTELTDALSTLSPEEIDQFEIHFVGPNAESVLETTGIDTASLNIVCHPPVSYFESLALQRQFDCVIVNDAETKDTFPINPYLPSKISDASNNLIKVWAITEPGSLLDTKQVEFKSIVGDETGAREVLDQLLKFRSLQS